MKNVMIYLVGFPGVGKYTIAQELCRACSDFRLVDNHLINNPLFSLIPLDGKTKIPERVWDNQVKIWQAVFDIMVNVSPAEFSFVLTNYLSQHKNDDIEHFGIIEGVAKSREAVFVPVRMHIEVEEHKKRISVPERTIRHKMTDKEAPSAYDQEDQIISIAHENLLDLDVTNLSAEAAANQILSFVGNILAKRSPA